MIKNNEKEIKVGDGVSADTEGDPHDVTATVESKQATPPNPKDAKKKTVEVDAETLDKLVSGYENLQKKVKDLEGAADLGRLQRIQAARNDGKLVKSAKVGMYDKKYVLGWVVVKDDVYFDESGKMNEDQQIKLFLHEGEGKASETKPMSYRQFSRLVTKIEGEVIKESRDSDGKISFTVLLPDGLELELPIVFLN